MVRHEDGIACPNCGAANSATADLTMCRKCCHPLSATRKRREEQGGRHAPSDERHTPRPRPKASRGSQIGSAHAGFCGFGLPDPDP